MYVSFKKYYDCIPRLLIMSIEYYFSAAFVRRRGGKGSALEKTMITVC